MTEQIKKLRVDIDYDTQSTATLLNATGAGLQNINNCFINLRLAKGWLGKVLHFLGEENPYTPADKPEDIPETVDVHKATDEPRPEIYEDSGDEAALRFINRLRDRISVHVTSVEGMTNSIPPIPGADRKVKKSLDHTWKHLQDASMHLGFQLQLMAERHQAVARHKERPEWPGEFDDEYYEKAATRLSGKK